MYTLTPSPDLTAHLGCVPGTPLALLPLTGQPTALDVGPLTLRAKPRAAVMLGGEVLIPLRGRPLQADVSLQIGPATVPVRVHCDWTALTARLTVDGIFAQVLEATVPLDAPVERAPAAPGPLTLCAGPVNILPGRTAPPLTFTLDEHPFLGQVNGRCQELIEIRGALVMRFSMDEGFFYVVSLDRGHLWTAAGADPVRESFQGLTDEERRATVSKRTPRRCPDDLRLNLDQTQWHLTTPNGKELCFLRLDRENRLVLQAELETAEGESAGVQPLLVIVEPLPLRLPHTTRDSLMDASGTPLHVRAWVGPVLDTGTLDDLTLHQQLEQAHKRAAQQGRTLGTAALLADAVRPLLTRFSWAKVHQIMGQWTAHRITCTAQPGGGMEIAVAGQQALTVAPDGGWSPSGAATTVTAQGGDKLLAAARHALTQRDAHEMFERLTGAVVLAATPECAWLLPLRVGELLAPATGLGQLVAQSG